MNIGFIQVKLETTGIVSIRLLTNRIFQNFNLTD